jgi:hypothetical protein
MTLAFGQSGRSDGPGGNADAIAVWLSKGAHRQPQRGVCAMELASLLAGERFTDMPSSVCRVIAGFIRAYNDRLDDVRRQDLRQLAASAVGTRGGNEATRERATCCFEWACQTRRRPVARLVMQSVASLGDEDHRGQVAGVFAARSVPIGSMDAHCAALAFLEELIEFRNRWSGEPGCRGLGHADRESVVGLHGPRR